MRLGDYLADLFVDGVELSLLGGHVHDTTDLAVRADRALTLGAALALMYRDSGICSSYAAKHTATVVLIPSA